VKRRILWCKANLPFTAADWNQVIFSDESTIATQCNTRHCVWRPINSRYKSKYTCKTLKYGGLSFLVWEAIRIDGYIILIQCPPRLSSQEYQEILRIRLSAQYTLQMGFMQDRAPCHRSSSALAYLYNKNVCLLSDWLAQSPDFNIIENMWALLKKNIQKHHSILKDDLWQVVQEEW